MLDQLTNLGRCVNSEFPKPKRGRKKRKKIELEDNDIRGKRERLVACILSGNSKMYLGKEYTEKQINNMDCNNVNTLLNRYVSVLKCSSDQIVGQKRYKFIFKHSLQCVGCWQSARTKYRFRE